MILQNTDAIPQLDTCCSSKNYPVFVPFGAVCGAYSIRPYNRVRIFLRKTVSSLSPSSPRCGAYSIRPYNWIRVTLQNTDAIFRPGTYIPSKNCLIFVTFGAVCGAYRIRPYNRVRAILRNTDAISQLDTCGPSKNCLVFVPFEVAGWAYSIRPYNWVRTILRNIDAIPKPGTCGPTKKLSRFRPLRGRLWGVFNTPLQSVTYGPSKNYSVFVPFGAACGAYSIRPYNRVCAILQNTDAIPQPDTCNPSKYRYDLLTEGAGVFGMWGGGGYRLRGRRA